MSAAVPRILLVDDTPLNLEALADALRADKYELEKAEDGEAAWEVLNQDPHFKVVLLDLMMPRLDGMGLLARLKGDTRFRHLPVILQTADASPERIAEGIQAGAFYYLTKPLNRRVLRSIVRAAVDTRLSIDAIQQEVAAGARSAALLQRAEFQFRSPEDARALASLLVRAYPDPDRVSTGIWELLINAVEHGNLAVTYDEKTELMQEHRILEELAARLERPELRDRVVRVYLERDPKALALTVEDEGGGFDWQQYLELSPDRAFHAHGRGIAMAKALSFDEIAYEGRGNRVTAKVWI